MRPIRPIQVRRAEVSVPGSKSYTHRMLIAAALADGPCLLENPLESDDTHATLSALARWGARFEERPEGLRVEPPAGGFQAHPEPIALGNSGTSLRLLTAVAALVSGRTVLTGSDRLKERPIRDLVDALARAGGRVQALGPGGFPPVAVEGGLLQGGRVALDCRASSQFLSALLLAGPLSVEGLEILVTHGPVSRPYVDITLDVLERFGVPAERRGYEWFRVAGGRRYRAGRHAVEPDASQAGYFWAAAAVTGATVKVRGIRRASPQGDVALLSVLERMGCRIEADSRGIAVTGGRLSAIEVDMGDIPDAVPTLAVVAAFARGRTVIRNVAHLRGKESDRLAAVAGELGRMGICTGCGEDFLWIEGGAPHGARIATHDDHRIAMSFAVAGLAVPGVVIADEGCVRKSFPGFWRVFETLEGGGAA